MRIWFFPVSLPVLLVPEGQLQEIVGWLLPAHSNGTDARSAIQIQCISASSFAKIMVLESVHKVERTNLV